MPRFRTEYALIAVGTVVLAITLSWSFYKPAPRSETPWPNRTVERMYDLCRKEVATKSPAIQEVVCGCQVAEMKRWLLPKDMPVHFAAVAKAKGWTEVDEFRNGFSQAEQDAFLKRINQLRESLLPTCAKVGFDAGITAQDIE